MTRATAKVVVGLLVTLSGIGLTYGLDREQRYDGRRAVEQVYWRHRIWPEQNPGPKPALSEVLPEHLVREQVEEALRKSWALESMFGRPITEAQMQAELRRMARDSRDPQTLRELWLALGNDPERVQEVLVRPALADRLLRSAYENKAPSPSFDAWWSEAKKSLPAPEPRQLTYAPLPSLAVTCTGAWTRMFAGVPQAREFHTAVWTGAEMIVWGGRDINDPGTELLGGRYDPATDTWSAVSTTGAPSQRYEHTAVWTGTEMIVWGGHVLDPQGSVTNSGGRYDPASNTWTLTTAQHAPQARSGHTAVWTGSQMIVWGGFGQQFPDILNSGSRYDPASNSWTATRTTSAPPGRYWHTAVWTGSEMIVWGGNTYDLENALTVSLDTGGRYSPATDSWSPTAAAQAPSARYKHTAVWSGNRMIVWGGTNQYAEYFATGARYDPSTDQWSATSTTNAPVETWSHTAVWTGTEMIVWGGGGGDYHADGGRYAPASDTWIPIPVGAGSPPGRLNHTAVWTGTEMIVWGGTAPQGDTKTGGRFAPATGTWSPTASTDPRPTGNGGTAIWTGAEMIVWGGITGSISTPARGSRYDPATDSWSAVADGHGSTCAHSVVWTGTEMIVWGGDDCWNFNGTLYGGRYNPATDSWTETPTFLAPSPRMNHTAVWTGTRMVVWGGHNHDFQGLSSGGRYDPATDSWVPTSESGAPSRRHSHAAVWTGTEMIVWGGAGNPQPVTPGGRYNPVSDIWSPISQSGAPVNGSLAVWTGDAMLAASASNGDGTMHRYDPGTDHWQQKTGTSGNFNSNAPAFGCGEMVVARSTGEFIAYDVASDTWNALFAPILGGNVVSGSGKLMIWRAPEGWISCRCDGRTRPPADVVLRVFETPDQLSWTYDGTAYGYDVVRGSLATLRGTAGDFTTATQACLADGTAGNVLAESTPVPADGFFYLVRVSDAIGDGSYDTGSASQVQSRDAGISSSIGACP